MSAYNVVSATLKCPSCSAIVVVPIQFKFANTWQLHYELGDSLQWGGNDVGERGKQHVVVDGLVEGTCPRCNYDREWNVYVHIEKDRVVRVENANGEFDFAKLGANYVVLS